MSSFLTKHHHILISKYIPLRLGFEFLFEKNTVHCFRVVSQGAIVVKTFSILHLSRTMTLFLHVQGVLELGAGVLGMKAFLVDGVIRVEPNHQGIPCRVDFFHWLRKRERKTI